MIYLKTLSIEKQDDIRILVGNSYLDLHFRKMHKVFNKVMNVLLKEVGIKYREELSALLYNSISALKRMDKGLYLSRNNITYTNFNKNNPEYKPISWRKIKSLLDILENLGYITNYSGYNDKIQGLSMSSCIVFSDKFISMFDHKDIDTFGRVIVHKKAVVREKLDDDLVVEIKNVQGIGKKQKEILEIQQWLDTHRFKFVTCEKKVDLQRIFLEDLTKSGRVYFGGLQCIERTRRRLYEINDVKVSEYDFDSNHMFICAELERVILPEDFKPYEIDVSALIQCEDIKKIRTILKFCCMFLLNSGTPEATFKKFWKSHIKLIDEAVKVGDYKSAEKNIFYGVSGLKNTKAVIKRLEEHNSFAKNYFRIKGGCWEYLQNIDSNIMLKIMQKMKDLDSPFLPYHDSIVVYKDNDIVINLMKESWREVLGSNNNCRVSKKY